MNNQSTSGTVLITGATSGIGKATATELAQRGLTVVIMSRDSAEGERTATEIRQASGNEHVELLVCDLSSQESIRAAANEFKRRFPKLNILINCAAVFVKKRIVTSDGLELMFATNHLGPFLLTNLLQGNLEAGAPARIINVTAPSPLKPHFDDLQGARSFNAGMAFGRTKADNLLFTYALTRRLKGKNIKVYAFHPGVVRNTGLMRNAPLTWRLPMRIAQPFLRTPEDVAKELADLALSNTSDIMVGRMIHDGKVMPSSLEKETEIQERLWQESVKLTKL